MADTVGYLGDGDGFLVLDLQAQYPHMKPQSSEIRFKPHSFCV
jgi:hypothetical protein